MASSSASSAQAAGAGPARRHRPARAAGPPAGTARVPSPQHAVPPHPLGVARHQHEPLEPHPAKRRAAPRRAADVRDCGAPRRCTPRRCPSPTSSRSTTATTRPDRSSTSRFISGLGSPSTAFPHLEHLRLLRRSALARMRDRGRTPLRRAAVSARRGLPKLVEVDGACGEGHVHHHAGRAARSPARRTSCRSASSFGTHGTPNRDTRLWEQASACARPRTSGPRMSRLCGQQHRHRHAASGGPRSEPLEEGLPPPVAARPTR